MFFDLAAFTAVHTIISLIALVTGIGVIVGLFGVPISRIWTHLFLITAVATSVTGFGFPFHGILPSHILAVIALVVLAPVLYGVYVAHLAGIWRPIYAVGATASVFFLTFVAITQAFGKIPALQSLAPTQTERPFVVSQLVALVIFVVVGIAATRSFTARAGGAAAA